MLTLSTTACLCGMYGLYELLIGPMTSPGASLLEARATRARPQPISSPENQRQAEQYLAHQPWKDGTAAKAKYQVRNEKSFIYADEWETIEDSKRVRLKPFAMIWRSKKQKLDDEPITIVCESAILTFHDKFEATNLSPNRIVGGALEGKVTILGPNGLAVEGRDFFFVEEQRRAWSDHPVKFAWGPHSGRGHGLEMDLIPEEGPPDDSRPAIAGVRTVRLIKDVVMDLVPGAKEGETPRPVRVTSTGSFEYSLESHEATFRRNVSVVQPTGPEEVDELKNADELRLVFVPVDPADGEDKPDGPAKKNDDHELGGDIKLQFSHLRAEGPSTYVRSQRSAMQAWMQQLDYDHQKRIIALSDARKVRLIQRNNELTCPEVTARLDEDGQIVSATCIGNGKLVSYSKTAPVSRGGTRPIEFQGTWLKHLSLRPLKPDEASGQTQKLDLIEFTGQAVLSQPQKMTLTGEVICLWITPVTERDARGPRGAREESPEQEEQPKPKRMLAIGDAMIKSPQLNARTERLEVWFEEGRLPPPPQLAAPKKPAEPTARRTSAAKTDRPERGRPAAKPAIEEKRQTPENPVYVVAGLIRVDCRMDGDEPQVAEVVATGTPDAHRDFRLVKVTQEHGAGAAPLELTGNWLRLLNYSERDHEVIEVNGQPAHIVDRGMQLEGAKIHFDRGKNFARVDGAGVIRFPMKNNGFDGKPAEGPLDVYWKEKMEFNGEKADFFGEVRTQLGSSKVHCEAMHVTLTKRISFSENSGQSQNAEPRLIVCREGVDFTTHEYEENRLVEIRTAQAYEFEFDKESGDIRAKGPGTILLWQRETGNRAALAGPANVKGNRGQQAGDAEWKYTEITFKGSMKGKMKEKGTDNAMTFTKATQPVVIVYGPVERSTERIDPDLLPLEGGWMSCNELELSQIPAQPPKKSTIAVVGRGNAKIDGRSEHGLFHAEAHEVSFDQSKGLYSLRGDGKRPATIWRELRQGKEPASQSAQRMEFIPLQNRLNITGGSNGQGGP